VDSLNCAQPLVGSLVGTGVDVCFMNPGMSEMHVVGALDASWVHTSGTTRALTRDSLRRTCTCHPG
jgi:thiamine pyrophosphate-dependent acetolactate synthase large subunit-like protein